MKMWKVELQEILGARDNTGSKHFRSGIGRPSALYWIFFFLYQPLDWIMSQIQHFNINVFEILQNVGNYLNNVSVLSHV